MILECPECRTRYLVPDSAIGHDGRTVRCANCRHSWFQEGARIELPPRVEEIETGVATSAVEQPPEQPPLPPPSPAFAPPPVEPFAAPATAPVLSPTPAFARAYDDVASDPVAPETSAVAYDAFAHRAPFRPRRNSARRWTALAVAAGLLMLLATGAILWVGAPGIAAQLGLPIGTQESPLRLRDNPIERRALENGSELFAVSGQVTNPSSERQRVPDIKAELRDARGTLVFSWTITPSARTLAPGAALDFNSAKLDVPANSKRLELSFAGETGG